MEGTSSIAEDLPKKRQSKRDCTEVVQSPADYRTKNETQKKLKKDKKREEPSSEAQPKSDEATADDKNSPPPHVQDDKDLPPFQVQDLETALNSVVGDSQNETLPDGSQLSFRLGHAGDASTLASWYRQETSSSTATATEKASPSLEIWLAEALGNEDTPPSLFALLADSIKPGQEVKTKKLAAAALLTLAWKNSSRVLRVEWFRIDGENNNGTDTSTFIERRTWLRLAALSLMTACELHVKDAPTGISTRPKETS